MGSYLVGIQLVIFKNQWYHVQVRQMFLQSLNHILEYHKKKKYKNKLLQIRMEDSVHQA